MPSHRPAARHVNLQRRALIIDAVRAFFSQAGYLEVETPVRIPAPAPEAHIEAQPSGNWFLQTSPELCMKRLLAAGCDKIFQICRCFRRGERGRFHLPEMTLLEWYAAGRDYTHLMVQCEDLITSLADRLRLGRHLAYQGCPVDLTLPWQRMTVADAFERFGGMTVTQALAQDRFDEIMGLAVEPCLGVGRPVFLTDYPIECGALARRKPGHPTLAERFELYLAGVELCNGFSELTDPSEQRARFEADNRRRAAAGKAAYPPAEPFLQAMSAMPAAAGNALGIDRLVMVLIDAATIDEVVAFTPETL